MVTSSSIVTARIISPNRNELERAVADYGIAWTIFPAGDAIVQILDQEPGWRRLLEEDGIVVHARTGPAPLETGRID